MLTSTDCSRIGTRAFPPPAKFAEPGFTPLSTAGELKSPRWLVLPKLVGNDVMAAPQDGVSSREAVAPKIRTVPSERPRSCERLIFGQISCVNAFHSILEVFFRNGNGHGIRWRARAYSRASPQGGS